jgi:2-C-methyl-D-erythritol 2,4-cyclodiphosphate synthase
MKNLKMREAKSFLKQVKKIVDENNFEILNIDSTIILEDVKLSPFVKEIKGRLSEILEIQPDKISIKPKRNEKFDSLGKGEAIACFAVVLIKPKGDLNGDEGNS